MRHLHPRPGFRVAGSILAGALSCAAAAAPVPESALAGLEFRLLGPFRGGWATTVVGVPAAPDTFYFGAAGGGVWRTVDAGRSWQPLFDRMPASAVGALALAASDPRVLYVGTGQPEARYDVAAGTGVYRSRDGGETWAAAGLAGTRHIGRLLVDPRDSGTALVAALGHYYAPDRERGIFRTSDGGEHWQQTLFIDDKTGVVDLAQDPANPDHLYAAAWQAQLPPWLSYFQPLEGEGSGLYRSTDGGRHWSRLQGEGWPAGPLGRIGLAVAHTSAGTRLYASVAAEAEGVAGLYRSDDDGAHWRRINEVDWLTSSYMSRITVSPADPDTLYTAGQSVHLSLDGGQTFRVFRGAPGGDDFHAVWINPRDPTHLAAASDQGAIVSVNGGMSWSAWDNQPTGQFYTLSTDHRFPYRVYSGQQDSGTVGIASRSDDGALGERDWHPVGAGERDYDLVDPANDEVVFGSDLGGRIVRYDSRTGQLQNVSPWPVNGYGKRPTHFRYHSGWFAPIAFAAQPPYTLYAGAQVLFKSEDRGQHWQVASPDLTGLSPAAAHCDGTPTREEAYACGYGVVTVIAPSPRAHAEVWVGTDDGHVWVTVDGTRTWRDATPAGLPHWVRIASIEPSAHRAGSAYVALDNHRQDDFAPRVLHTEDFGKAWLERGAGLPGGHYVSVVREDPVREGLLYAGTEQGLALSFDGGRHWQPWRAGLPTVWVHDLKVKDDDLIAATVGRGLWVLDDLTPLREMNEAVLAEPLHLFAPARALRLRAHANRDTPPPPETPLAANPPTGAIIDYSLASAARGPLTLEIRDEAGSLLRRFSSSDAAPEPPAKRYFTDDWVRRPARLETSAGAHRFVWDLRAPAPTSVHYEFDMPGARSVGAEPTPQGPLVLPGRYHLRLAADGVEREATLTVANDPRSHATPEMLKATFAFERHLGLVLARLSADAGEVKALRTRLLELRRLALPAIEAPLAALEERSKALADGEGDSTLSFAALADMVAALAQDLTLGDAPPTAAVREVAAACERQLAEAQALWRSLKSREVPALDASLAAQSLPPLAVAAAAAP